MAKDLGPNIRSKQNTRKKTRTVRWPAPTEGGQQQEWNWIRADVHLKASAGSSAVNCGEWLKLQIDDTWGDRAPEARHRNKWLWFRELPNP